MSRVRPDQICQIGVTFDSKTINYLHSILSRHGIETFSEGTGASGYWINVRKECALEAMQHIRKNFRYMEGDLLVALLEPGELDTKTWTRERFLRLIRRLPGEKYHEAVYQLKRERGED